VAGYALDQPDGSIVVNDLALRPLAETTTWQATPLPVDQEMGNLDRLVGPFVVPKEIVDDLVAGNLPCQGDGQCAKLPQILLGGKMGLTKEWIGVQNVTDFESGPQRGTVLATVDKDSREYPGAPTGNHVVIFLELVRLRDGRVTGMKVVEQFVSLDKPRVTTIPLPSSNTPIPEVPSAAAIKDMRTYWVVYRRVRE
jgi:hypothetical protein